MSALFDTLISQITTGLAIQWSNRDGQVVPETGDIVLKNGAVTLDAVYLYADLAASSQLAKLCPWETTAQIIRAYLDLATRLIRAHGGHIRSFDGDRVMGVFVGPLKNTSAVECARNIFWMVEKELAPRATARFNSVRNNGITIRNCVGVAHGEARAVRAGIRDNSDLIWIGKAPSFAAKLSDIREWPYCVLISDQTYKALGDASKLNAGNNIWEARTITFGGASETIYRTQTMKRP